MCGVQFMLQFWLTSLSFPLAPVDTLLRPQRVARRHMPCSRKTARARSGAGLWWAPFSGGHSNGVALNRCPQPGTQLTDTRMLPAHTGRLHGVSWWSRSSVPVASTLGHRPLSTGTAPAQVALSTAGYRWMSQHARKRRSRRRSRSCSEWTPNSACSQAVLRRRRHQQMVCASHRA